MGQCQGVSIYKKIFFIETKIDELTLPFFFLSFFRFLKDCCRCTRRVAAAAVKTANDALDAEKGEGNPSGSGTNPKASATAGGTGAESNSTSGVISSGSGVGINRDPNSQGSNAGAGGVLHNGSGEETMFTKPPPRDGMTRQEYYEADETGGYAAAYRAYRARGGRARRPYDPLAAARKAWERKDGAAQ